MILDALYIDVKLIFRPSDRRERDRLLFDFKKAACPFYAPNVCRLLRLPLLPAEHFFNSAEICPYYAAYPFGMTGVGKPPAVHGITHGRSDGPFDFMEFS